MPTWDVSADSSTRGPSWGHPRFVLGAIGSFVEPFCGYLSPKVDTSSVNWLLVYPAKGLAWSHIRMLSFDAVVFVEIQTDWPQVMGLKLQPRQVIKTFDELFMRSFERL